MLRVFKILAFLSVVFVSCKENKETPAPPDLIPEEQMTNILVDIHLLEASSSLNILTEKTDDAKKNISVENIYNKYHIEKAQFTKSLRYYTSRPEKIDAIYEQVVNQLNKLQAEAMEKKVIAYLFRSFK